MQTGITLRDAVLTSVDSASGTYTFAPDGVIVPSGLHLSDTGVPQFFERVQMTIKNRPSVLNVKTSLLSKEKRTVSFAKPYTPVNQETRGGLTFTTVRFEVESHPEAVVDRQLMVGLLQDFLASPDASAFITRGSLA